MASAPRVLIPLSTNGHDPTEVAIPYTYFRKSGLAVDFATESGEPFACDPKMLGGIVGTLLGAAAPAKKAYQEMMSSTETRPGSVKRPLCWKDAGFLMEMAKYDLIFLPGGHEKGVRTLIESAEIHAGLQKVFPETKRDGSGKKVVAAVCHGVQVLSSTPDPGDPQSGKSIIRSCTVTALPAHMESGIYSMTKMFLGDYYKTYGHGSPNVEDFVAQTLDDPSQFKAGPTMWSGRMGDEFVVVDDKYRLVTGRWPGDAEGVARKAVEEVRAVWTEQGKSW